VLILRRKIGHGNAVHNNWRKRFGSHTIRLFVQRVARGGNSPQYYRVFDPLSAVNEWDVGQSSQGKTYGTSNVWDLPLNIICRELCIEGRRNAVLLRFVGLCPAI
jgi:hypothetical protein